MVFIRNLINIILAWLEYPYYVFYRIYLWIPGHKLYDENHFASSLCFILYYSFILKFIFSLHLDFYVQNRSVYLSFLVLAIAFYFNYFYKDRFKKVVSKYDLIKG